MIIVVGAEKGGVGKTRLATHIALLAKTQGVDVALLDTDRQGSAVSWSRIRSELSHDPQVPCFPLSTSALKEIADLSSKYDLLVIDIGAQNYKTMLETAIISDLVLVPCGPDQQEVESTFSVFTAIKEIRETRGADINARVVLTRTSVRENARATRDLIELFEQNDIPVLASVLATREAWRTSGKTGQGVFELSGKDYSDKAADEINAVFNEIKEVLNNGN